MKRSHRVISASATVFVAGAFVLAGGVAPASAADGNIVVDPQLKACINVEYLKRPATTAIVQADLKALKAPSATTAALSCASSAYAGITTVQGLEQSEVRRLTLNFTNGLKLAEIDATFSDLTKLRLQNAIFASDEINLAELTRSATTLREFAVTSVDLPGGGMSSVDTVIGIDQFPNLYELNVNAVSTQSLEGVGALTKLGQGYLQYNFLDEEDLKSLATSPKLTGLNVTSNNISDLSWIPAGLASPSIASQRALSSEVVLVSADDPTVVKANPTHRPIDRDGGPVVRGDGTLDEGVIVMPVSLNTAKLVENRFAKTEPAGFATYAAYEWRSKTKPKDALSYIAYPVVEVDLRDNLALSATVGESVTLSPIDFSYDTGVSARAAANIPTFEATSFAVAEGALPEGLTLSATDGTIAGTPTAEGSAAFTIVATDAHGNDVIGNYAVAVAPASTTDAVANTNGGEAEATANASASEGTSTADGATANADGSEATAAADGTEAAAQAAGNADAIAAADGAAANADGSEASATTDGTGDALGAGAGGAANGESANGTSSGTSEGTANADGATTNADGSEATAAADGTEAAAQAAGNADAIAAADGETANATSNGTSEGTTNADGATANADGSEATAAADGTEAAAQAAGNADAIAAADGADADTATNGTASTDGATANAAGSEATATTDATGDALGAGAGGAANGETASATSDGTAAGSAADGDTANSHTDGDTANSDTAGDAANGADDESGANADTTAGAEAGSDTNADATGGTSEAAVEGTSETKAEASADGATAEGTNDSAADGTTGDADAAGSEAETDANGSEAGAAATGSETETEANATTNATNGNGTNGEKPADTNQSGDALAVTGVGSSAIVTAAVLAFIALLAGAALLGRRRA